MCMVYLNPGELDLSYHIRTNMCVGRGNIGGVCVHNVYTREILFSLVCTLRKAIKNFEL